MPTFRAVLMSSAIACSALLGASQASGQTGPQNPAKPAAVQAQQPQFGPVRMGRREGRPQVDSNQDGLVSKAEFDACFNRGDRNHDGRLGFMERLSCTPDRGDPNARGRLNPQALQGIQAQPQRQPNDGRRYRMLDRNRDSVVDRDEFNACFVHSDTNRNGTIEMDESWRCEPAAAAPAQP